MPLDIPSVERFVGTYDITDARTPAGQTVVGSMVLTCRGRFLHADASLNPLGQRVGIAIPFAGRLVLAFGPKDKVEIGAYAKSGQQLDGLWVPPGADFDDLDRCGHEPSTRQPDGSYQIARAVSIDGSDYHGSLSITPRSTTAWPHPVDLAWTLHDGVYRSFGLDYPDALFTTFSFEPDQPHGIIVYDLDGPTLKGTTITNTGSTPTYETLTRGS